MHALKVVGEAMAETGPVAVPEIVVAPPAALLDDDEIIQLSIKPSLWFIPFVSAKWLLACGLLLAATLLAGQRGAWPQGVLMTGSALSAVAAGRVGYAILQWASQLYVLTNRRVLRFRGIFTVDVAECLLARVSRIDLRVPWSQSLLSLGTIHMSAADANALPVVWEHVAGPAEVYQILVKAVRRAQSG